MGFPNLRAEMARHGVKASAIAKELDIDANNVYPLLNGSRKMTVGRAIKIKKAFFPDESLEYLFSEEPVDDRLA